MLQQKQQKENDATTTTKLSSLCCVCHHEILCTAITNHHANNNNHQCHDDTLGVVVDIPMMNWLALLPSFHHGCNCQNGIATAANANTANTANTATAMGNVDADIISTSSLEIVTAETDPTRTDTIGNTAASNGTVHHKGHFICSLTCNNMECHPKGTTVKSLLSHLGNLKEQMGSLAQNVCGLKQQSTLGIQTTPENEFRRASRNLQVNPFEFLYIEFDGNPLISRSALKLANIDALVDFCLCPSITNSRADGSLCTPKEFLFVDLCGAPGGFSQYILFRCKEYEIIETDHPIGYGMSLGGENADGMGIKWNKALHCGNEKRFKIHFGSDGTGDIYNWENVLSLQHTIYKDWNRSRVNLVVADGGFDAQRDCKDQEGVATNLVICQVAAAFQLLEYGGNFVLKLFGFQSAAIRYVMETLMVQFETVKIVKPLASRPASAERYVVGLGFRQCGKWKDLDTATELDAFVWRRDGLIMDEKVIIEEDVEDETKKRALYDLLDRFDCDIASLNIDACEKILHCLQIQQQRFLIGDRRRKKSKMKHVMAEPKIDVQHIRKMWHL